MGTASRRAPQTVKMLKVVNYAGFHSKKAEASFRLSWRSLPYLSCRHPFLSRPLAPDGFPWNSVSSSLCQLFSSEKSAKRGNCLLRGIHPKNSSPDSPWRLRPRRRLAFSPAQGLSGPPASASFSFIHENYFAKLLARQQFFFENKNRMK